MLLRDVSRQKTWAQWLNLLLVSCICLGFVFLRYLLIITFLFMQKIVVVSCVFCGLMLLLRVCMCRLSSCVLYSVCDSSNFKSELITGLWQIVLHVRRLVAILISLTLINIFLIFFFTMCMKRFCGGFLSIGRFDIIMKGFLYRQVL